MEQDGDSEPIIQFQPLITTTRRRNPPIDPVILILLFPILLLLVLFFFFFHPLLVHIPKSIKPTFLKSSWDSLKILVVFFAILCGVFAHASTNSPSDPAPPLSIKTRRRRASRSLGRDETVVVTSRIDKIHIETESQLKPQTPSNTKIKQQKPYYIETEPQLKLQTTPNTKIKQQKPYHIETEPQLKLQTTPNTKTEQLKLDHIETEPQLKLQTTPDTKHEPCNLNKLKTDLYSFNQKLYQTAPRSPQIAPSPLPPHQKHNKLEGTLSVTTTEPAIQPPPPPPVRSILNALFKSGRKKKRTIQMKPPSPPLQRKPEALRRRPAATTTIEVGDSFGPSPIYFPSPDVNVKADNFISRRKDEWRMENIKFS